jgi:hypothetical protein
MDSYSPCRNRCLCLYTRLSSACALLVVLSASTALAQLPQARLYAIFPCGGKAGTTFDLELTRSEDLDEADRLVFNHPGITATAKTRDVGARKEPVANTFSVTVAPDVPSGLYEVRASGLYGLSNPRIFVVGSQPETHEVEPNNGFDRPNELPLGTIVNATVGGETDVDVYRFTGKKGQRFVAFCRAADLDSRLEPVLELTDDGGRRLAHARQELHRDPVIDAVLPADATYYLKVYDFLYRGGPDYVYRLGAGSIPHIDFIMPPAGVAGSTAKYTLFGRNLPGGEPAGIKIDGRPLEKCEVAITLPSSAPLAPAHTILRSLDAGLGVVSYVAKTPFGESNPVLIGLAPRAPILEREPNDTPETAQEMPAPGEFVGQFQSPGDTDYIKFHARAGQVFVIEVFADRLGSQADPYLVVEEVERNTKGKETVTRMTAVDDENSNIAPGVFDTRTDDPSYRFRAPADGTYRIMLRDRSFESRGDPRMVYRLSIHPEEPDFQLVVLPRRATAGRTPAVSAWPLGLRKGDSRDVEILVIRKDGFREPIDVRAEGLPKGVTCRGTVLASNAKSGELIFTAAEDAPESSALIHVFGMAKVSDAKKVAALAQAEGAVGKAEARTSQAAANLATADEALRQAKDLVATNRKLAATDSKNPTFAKAVADAELAVGSASKSVEQLKQSQKDADDRLAQARTQRDAAAKAAAPRELQHEAVPGSIVWGTEQLAQNVSEPAISRVAQSLALSVMKESAPFQLSTDVARLEVNQGRQILLPLKLARRAGFDGDVGMTLMGLAPGNLNIQNAAFPKGKSEELLRLLVAKGTRPGTYAVYWNTQAAVAYRQNVPALERAEREQAAAAKASDNAAAAAKKLSTAREQGSKHEAECASSLKALRPRLAQLEKSLAAARAEIALSAKNEKKPASGESEAVAETTARLAEVARKAADEAETNAKSASQSAQPELQARAAAARLLARELRKNADDAAARVASKSDPARADKGQNPAVGVDKLTAEIDETRQKLAIAEAALKSAADARQKAQSAAMAAVAKSKELSTAKAAADARLAAARQAAAPRNLTDIAPSTPFLLTVKAAPFDVGATVPKKGELKLGASLDLKVKLRRARGFRGPVTLNLPLPPGVAGIKAAPTTISAAKTEGVLTIVADKSATQGAIANLVVRGAAEFEGKAEVDAPISIKVVP